MLTPICSGGSAALTKARNVRGGGLEYYFPALKGWCEYHMQATLVVSVTCMRLSGMLLADESLLKMDAVQKVLNGESAIGKFNVYFIDTPTFNKKHGIEDDTGYGVANGYGTVAVDLAAEAAKMKETMKALRKAQMDKPPPVAMKLNKETGEMEKFVSSALTDDFAEVEEADGEIELPCGDDY